MKDLLDIDGENRAVRMFLALYGGACGVTIGKMRKHLDMAGFNGDAWPAWAALAHDDVHLTKMGAQMWLRHLFALEQNVDTSEEHVHVSDKNVHVPSTRDLTEAESLTLRRAGYDPKKYRRVLVFNDKPTPISQCEFGELCVHCNPPKGVSHA